MKLWEQAEDSHFLSNLEGLYYLAEGAQTCGPI